MAFLVVSRSGTIFGMTVDTLSAYNCRIQDIPTFCSGMQIPDNRTEFCTAQSGIIVAGAKGHVGDAEICAYTLAELWTRMEGEGEREKVH